MSSVLVTLCWAGVDSGLSRLPQKQKVYASHKMLQIAELNVCEVLVPKGGNVLSPESKSMLKGLLPDARFSLQPASTWDSGPMLVELRQGTLFPDTKVPAILHDAAQAPEQNEALLRAFAGMQRFLNRSMLADAVLKIGTVESLPGRPAVGKGMAFNEDKAATSPSDNADAPQPQDSELEAPPGSKMVLDASALSNLEVWLILTPLQIQ